MIIVSHVTVTYITIYCSRGCKYDLLATGTVKLGRSSGPLAFKKIVSKFLYFGAHYCDYLCRVQQNA